MWRARKAKEAQASSASSKRSCEAPTSTILSLRSILRTRSINRRGNPSSILQTVGCDQGEIVSVLVSHTVRPHDPNQWERRMTWTLLHYMIISTATKTWRVECIRLRKGSAIWDWCSLTPCSKTTIKAIWISPTWLREMHSYLNNMMLKEKHTIRETQ